MNKYEELANEIIEKISDWIEEKYNIKPKVFDKDSGLENPALINGVQYYDLEGEVADMIKDLLKKVKK